MKDPDMPQRTSSSTGKPRWYLVHCKPRQERRALENLERQRFECLRPTRRVEKVQSGRRREILEPLFPAYLFIRLDTLNDNWLPIRSTPGVNRIVRFNDYPLPVPDPLVEEIRRRLVEPVKEPYFKCGERVFITEGCFSEMEALFVSNDGNERVTLLMKILSRDHELSFPVASVRKISNPL